MPSAICSSSAEQSTPLPPWDIPLIERRGCIAREPSGHFLTTRKIERLLLSLLGLVSLSLFSKLHRTHHRPWLELHLINPTLQKKVKVRYVESTCGTISLSLSHTHTSLTPRMNYTDRVTVACHRSYCQLLRIEGATWSARRIPF
jgi:hypothetical protein